MARRSAKAVGLGREPLKVFLAAPSRPVDYLRRTQDRVSGRWTAVSPNKQRDQASDTGKFMSDAATAYAVLSLTYRP